MTHMFKNLTYIECFPNCSCEDLAHCFLGQTNAFWSSSGYFFFALVLYFQVKRRTFEFEFWVFATVTLAISSFIFHSTYTMIAVALDYASIAMVISFFMLLYTLQKHKFTKLQIEAFFFLYYVVLWSCFYFLSKWFRVGLCLILFGLSVWEIFRHQGLAVLKNQDLAMSVILIHLAFVGFLLEELGVWCDPGYRLQGHTLWHLLSAMAIYLYGRWRFISGTESWNSLRSLEGR